MSQQRNSKSNRSQMFLFYTSLRLLLKLVRANASEIRRLYFIRSFFYFFGWIRFAPSQILMSKFSGILVLMCRKIFSSFSNETFSKPFPPYVRVIYFSHHLVFHAASDHQKLPLLGYDLKNVLTKHFPKM